MKQHLPRCSLPLPRDRFSPTLLKLPDPNLAHPCVHCGERSVYCVHKRKDNTHVCENCFRKAMVQNIAKNKQWLWDDKAESGCVLCGENDPRCLDYHHVHPKKKKFSIGSMTSSIPTKAIRIEQKKCVVVCANCHRQLEVMKKPH